MKPEFAKDLYFHELNQKAELDARAMTIVGLMTIIGSIMVYFLRKAWPVDSMAQIIVAVFGGLSVVGFAASVYYLFLANLGFRWQVLSPPSALLEHSNRLRLYFEEYPDAEGDPEKDFEDYLTDHLSQAATRNGENNLQRSAYYYKTTSLLAWVVVLLAVAAVASAYGYAIGVLESGG
jgi:hypothetical protein